MLVFTETRSKLKIKLGIDLFGWSEEFQSTLRAQFTSKSLLLLLRLSLFNELVERLTPRIILYLTMADPSQSDNRSFPK